MSKVNRDEIGDNNSNVRYVISVCVVKSEGLQRIIHSSYPQFDFLIIVHVLFLFELFELFEYIFVKKYLRLVLRY